MSKLGLEGNFEYTEEEIEKKQGLLLSLGFVYLSSGIVQMGTDNPIPCRLEGHRKNETPVRSVAVAAFWISKYCVTNREYERFMAVHNRPFTSERDKDPVTDVTYLNALKYAIWMSETYNLSFKLPTEPEWTYAAGPVGWEFPYHADRNPNPLLANTFSPVNRTYHTLEVDDRRYGTNCYDLYHMGGNVQEFTYGHYNIPSGSWGAETDGMYCIVKGGDFGHCPLSAGIQRRGIVDVSDRSTRLGIRLAHSDLNINLKK